MRAPILVVGVTLANRQCFRRVNVKTLVLALLLAFTVTEAVAQAARGYDTSGR